MQVTKNNGRPDCACTRMLYQPVSLMGKDGSSEGLGEARWCLDHVNPSGRLTRR